MRGHIVQRSKGSYSIVIELDKDAVTRKRRQQSVTVRGSHKDAEKKLSELLRQLDTGSYIQPGKVTLADYLTRWLAEYVKPNLSPRSYERYADIVTRCCIPKLGNIKLTQLKADRLQKLYTDWLESGLSARTVRYHHAVIHKALELALKAGQVSRNVADAVIVPRIKRSEMQTWNEDELNAFLEAAKDGPYYELFYLVLFTGMRRSEILALRWQDIDLLYGQVSVSRAIHHLKDGSYIFTQPKSAKSRRTIALPPSAVLLLKRYYDNLKMDYAMLGESLNDDTLVFSTLGQPLRPNTITRAWTSLAVRAGIKRIRFHDARHTHASLMLKQGIHPKIVQERLGHSSIAMTLDIYSHVAPGLQEAAAVSFDNLVNNSVSKR